MLPDRLIPAKNNQKRRLQRAKTVQPAFSFY